LIVTTRWEQRWTKVTYQWPHQGAKNLINHKVSFSFTWTITHANLISQGWTTKNHGISRKSSKRTDHSVHVNRFIPVLLNVGKGGSSLIMPKVSVNPWLFSKYIFQSIEKLLHTYDSSQPDYKDIDIAEPTTYQQTGKRGDPTPLKYTKQNSNLNNNCRIKPNHMPKILTKQGIDSA
jgi:hypothetical protein